MIRVAHYYDFPKASNETESIRYGYCYGFHLIKSGKGKIVVSGQTYPIRKGDLLYFPPSLRHSFFSDTEQPLSSYNVYCELWSPIPSNTYCHLVWDVSDFDPSYLTLKAFILEFIQLSQAPLLTDYRIKPIIDLINQEANAVRDYDT
ncbi:hypothetical protein PMSD_22810 [Paenibacillus macquariensis subsp. defensor]|nr:hypothetical protein PMSD_22810 [Paenibacillus macquariensis subsp. defensor]